MFGKKEKKRNLAAGGQRPLLQSDSSEVSKDLFHYKDWVLLELCISGLYPVRAVANRKKSVHKGIKNFF